jgi:glycosyltransferase involved in cell wall biosynthesis
LVHDCVKELYYPIPKAALARLRKKHIYRNATALIAISHATRLDMLRLHGEEIEDRIRVIHNPVDFRHIMRCSTTDEASPEFSRVTARIGNRPFALFIGYRAAVKNFREVRHLLKALPEFVVVAVGPPPTPAELQQAQDLMGRIIYAGPLPDEVMFSLLKRSEFLFFPSMLEGFGLPVIESLFLGIPVLALDTQVNNEVSLGLIAPFETGSPDSIRVAVDRLKPVDTDGPIHRQLVERYDPKAVAQSYLRVIREFL